MAKKKKRDFKKQKFESAKPDSTNEPFVRIFLTMLISDAFLDLSNGARNIYLYMKAQFFCEKNIEIDGLKLGDEYFYFNFKMYSEIYGICTNRNQFCKYKNELIQHGFIEEFASGKQSRTKTIYKFSDKWQCWNK